MSVIEQELFDSRITRKRAIGTILLAGLLISAFAFSTALFSLILGTQRLTPNEELANAEQEDAILVNIPSPYNLEDLLSFLDQDSLETLMDMFDGNIDNLNLAAYAALLGALLYSDEPVFYVYNYDDFNNMSDVLWKYESFDKFNGDEWECTFPRTLHNFISLTEYYNSYSSLDLLKIKMPLEPDEGANSMVIPSLFPNPYIIEGSFDADTLDPNSVVLYKTNMNSTTVDLNFYSSDNVNMSYELFGLKLPSNEEINNSAVDESYTPSAIKNTYLQLPPDITTYINTHPNFKKHYDILNSIIKPSDNAFQVANKIRNYLQDNFTFGFDAYQSDPPQDGEDTVEWFCEKEEGLWSDFASAFCVFCRAFGVASRFINGFNSRNIEEFYDKEEATNGFTVKYKNMYNWAEIYIPTDTSGNGYWVQMDILYDSFGSGGNPFTEEEFHITVESNFTSGNRGSIAQINATLTSPTASVEGRKVTFTDTTSGVTLGEATTNNKGVASILVNIDNNQVIGPHLIKASYFSAINYTTYVVYGPIRVNLLSLFPNEVNRSITNSTHINGYVDDPINGQRVKNATVEFVLLNKDTKIKQINPFNILYMDTDENGIFDTDLLIQPHIPNGEYLVRVDFNGSWNAQPLAAGIVEDSSNILPLNITSKIEKRVFLYLDSYSSQQTTLPKKSRFNSLNITVYVKDGSGTPLSGELVEFFDLTNNSKIGEKYTNSNGSASILYNIGNNLVSGPHLISAKVGGIKNYSYFVLNETPNLVIISGPTPNIINRTGSGTTQFSIAGQLVDAQNGKPIPKTQIKVLLIKNGYDNSTYLVPNEAYPYLTGIDGKFNLTFGVASNTPPGNYSILVKFTGNYNRLDNIYYPYNFSLNNLSCNRTASNELQIDAPDIFIFNLWINGTTTDDYNNPAVSIGSKLNFTVYLQWGVSPIADGEWVDFFDLTSNKSIGSSQTTNGYASLIYNVDSSLNAGPHLIYAEWNNKYNYSYYIINSSITIDLYICPIPPIVNRSGSLGREFQIIGYINDSNTGKPIKYTEIEIRMFDLNHNDASFYLTKTSGSLQCGETGFINLTYIVSSSTPENNYTLEVWFNGTFLYSPPYNDFNSHNFYLTSFKAFSVASVCPNQLKVLDPYNIKIYLSVDGQPTRASYDNANPPGTYKRGDNFTLTVWITQSGINVTTGTVRVYDIFTTPTSLIAQYTFKGSDRGKHTFTINTTDWMAGLHKLVVNWSIYSTSNYTFIVINETLNIYGNLNNFVITRNIESFTVSGILKSQSNSLRGLEINLNLLNETHGNVTQYLIMSGNRIITINDDGTYQFNINSISLSCPQGIYYIRVDFNGTIKYPGVNLYKYMITNSSILLQINITASSNLNPDTYWTEHEDLAPDKWIAGDIFHANGTLLWDNGTAMANMYVNVTVKLLDGTVIAYNDTVQTDANGYYEITIVIDSNWPTYRSDSEIWVEFDPIYNGVNFVEGDSEKYP
ncbi:MAG: transglutaminase domain-containing protein [Promethearchaeota archaeon]